MKRSSTSSRREERQAFRALTTDEDRERFIEQFWLKRDPTPGTPENEYREEHYRRIAYADETFATNAVPGWKTDRGRIYIKYGPPVEREAHPGRGFDGTRGPGKQAVEFPSEKWRYRYIEGMEATWSSISSTPRERANSI